MSKGIPKPKGCVGKKGRSGRKTDAEIVRKYIDLELANGIANRELKRIDEKGKVSLAEMKITVVPIALKGMAENKRVEIITPKPILYAISSGVSDNQNNADEEENKSSAGGNISIENNLNSAILDTLSTE